MAVSFFIYATDPRIHTTEENLVSCWAILRTNDHSTIKASQRQMKEHVYYIQKPNSEVTVFSDVQKNTQVMFVGNQNLLQRQDTVEKHRHENISNINGLQFIVIDAVISGRCTKEKR